MTDKHHIALVGAYGRVAGQFLEAARENDCDISFVHEPGKVPDAHRELARRVIDVDDLAGVGEVLDVVRKLHGEHPVDYILSLTEYGVVSAATVAETLGIHTTVPLRVAEALRNKHRMREILGKHPELRVRSAYCAELNQALAAADRFGYPVIVKPDSAWGSLAVCKAEDERMLRDAFRSVRGVNQQALVEEYLDGPEHAIVAFSSSGRHQVIAVTGQEKLENFVPIGHVVPGVSHEKTEEFAKVLRAFLDAVELTDGITHTEVIATSAGIRIVESHNRPGGASVAVLVELATGVRLGELALLAAMGRSDLPWEPEYKGSAAIAFWNSRAGTVRSVPEFDEETRARYVEICLPIQPGMRVNKVLHGCDRLGYVISRGTDSERAYAAAVELVNASPVQIDPDTQRRDPEEDVARARRYARGRI